MFSKKLSIVLSTAFISTSIFILPSFATPKIELNLSSKKVLKQKNKEELVEAKDVKPGDVILYTIKVSNSGDTAALEVKPDGDIPDRTVYIQEKSDLKDIDTLFSIDKGINYSSKPKMKLIEKGKEVSKDAPIEKYNKIQWIIKKLDAKKTIELKYKVKVQ